MTTQDICIIPARAGSKGIPRKNLKLFNGKPLILNILDIAIETQAFCNIIASSDIEEILELCATRPNVVLHKRSKDLSDDQTPLDSVIIAASSEFSSDPNLSITTLQPTSPLISTKTIVAAIERFHRCKCDTLVSVKQDSHLRWGVSIHGEAFPLCSSRQNRQFASKEYVETGAIVICTAETLQRGTRFGSDVELFVTHHPETIDIDSSTEWELATRYSKKSKILFNVVGGSEFGFGHLYNTLALADCLPDFECIFVVPPGSAQALEFLQSFNYRVEQVQLEE
jgi:CMP-N-acetylneuraminic acid synthetase